MPPQPSSARTRPGGPPTLIVHRPAPELQRALHRLRLDRHVLMPEPPVPPAA
ncbi:hypothetical protein ACI797_09090 [Geodermatophilus sp. SYSU D00691]